MRLEVAIKNSGDLQGIEASFNPQSIWNKGLLGKVTIPLFFIMMDFGTQIWQKLKLAGVVSIKSTTVESELYMKKKNKAKLEFGGIPMFMPWHVKQCKKDKSHGMAEVAEKEQPQLNSVTTILQTSAQGLNSLKLFSKASQQLPWSRSTLTRSHCPLQEGVGEIFFLAWVWGYSPLILGRGRWNI